MPIDRAAALRTAERLLRQGKLDGAIEQYVRLIEEQPRDWNSINALGDLYVRAGDTDRAVAQYVRIADFLFGEGFLPKAAALYKKALKVRNDHEHTLLRLSDIAVRQELLADAKLYLRQLVQQRRNRGDEQGVAECLVRIAAIDEGDGDAKVAAARTAQRIGDTTQAVTLLQDAAVAFDKDNRSADALSARVAAAELAPAGSQAHADVARALIAAGQMERAEPFLSLESAGEDPDLLVAVGRRALKAGRTAEAQASLMRAVALAPDRREVIATLADELASSGRVVEAYSCVEILVDAAMFEAAFERAAVILERFVRQHALIPALLKLVDVYVDAGFDDRMTMVQGQLADAYLEEGQASEARVVAEDLMAREPHVEAHVERLRRALTALGIEHIDDVIARQRESDSMLPDPFALAENEGLAFPVAGPVVQPVDEAPIARVEPDPPREDPRSTDDPDVFEIDLSGTLAGLHTRGMAGMPRAAQDEPEEHVLSFDGLLEEEPARAVREEPLADAGAQFDRAQEYLRRGMTAEAAAALQAAARVPQFRFKAAAQLGRLSVSRGDLRGGIEWLERAAAAPSPVVEETFAVLYDLADALEGCGEPVRALAVFMELEADAGPYRNVRERIEQVARAAAGVSSAPHGDRS